MPKETLITFLLIILLHYEENLDFHQQQSQIELENERWTRTLISLQQGPWKVGGKNIGKEREEHREGAGRT